jgi:peptidyl-tRNA hydrolase, PTH1 family
LTDKVNFIAGLGNPDVCYHKTRHNAGFMVLDFLHESLSADEWKKWQGLGLYAKANYKGNEIYLIKPMTYMNRSGDMVLSISRFYKIKPEDMLVCYDDFSLPLGKIRIRKSGSAGGHNGMQDIITKLGTRNIPRLKIGIGPKPDYDNDKSFVLSKFKKDEMKVVEEVLSFSKDAVCSLLSEDIDTAMNRFN